MGRLAAALARRAQRTRTLSALLALQRFSSCGVERERSWRRAGGDGGDAPPHRHKATISVGEAHEGLLAQARAANGALALDKEACLTPR